KERFVWGRSYAGTRARLAGTPRRVVWAVFTPLLPGLLVARMTLMAWKKRRTMGAFLKALPLTALLEVGWSCGEFIGYATARANAAGAQTAEALARGSGAVLEGTRGRCCARWCAWIAPTGTFFSWIPRKRPSPRPASVRCGLCRRL